MKAFNLEEYLKNPDQKVITRDGKPARIICTDKRGDKPVVALIPAPDNKMEITFYTSNGFFYKDGMDNCDDLMFAPTKKEGWVNIYASQIAGTRYPGYSVFPNENEARLAVENKQKYVATVKIEWEE